LGKLYFSKKDCENAQPHLALGRIAGRTDAESDLMRGTCHLFQGQNELSISLISAVLTHSRSYEALNNLGVAYLRQGNISAALSALLEARNASRGDSTASQNLAIAHCINGNSAAARGVIEEGIQLHSKNGMLHCIHSFILARQGESEKAAEALSRARGLGVNVDDMSTVDLKNWTRILFTREP
jgi:Flp pilus assembly protein TadD